MDFLTLAKQRYSLRKFSTAAVEQDKLDKILTAAQLAPTAVNYQPQRILVLDGETNREKVKECTQYAFNAPLYLLVCYDNEKSWKRDSDGRDFGNIDAAITATHMMLEAAELGLGTCYVGAFDADKAKEVFNLPENYYPELILPLGYPAENAHPAHLHEKRLDLSETVFYEHF